MMCNGSMEGISGDLKMVATGERRGANGEGERQILDTCLGLDICLTPLYLNRKTNDARRETIQCL